MPRIIGTTFLFKPYQEDKGTAHFNTADEDPRITAPRKKPFRAMLNGLYVGFISTKARTATCLSTMKHLAPFLPLDNIVLELDHSSKEQVFEAISQLFEQRHGISHNTVTENLLAREQLGSTALGAGVAIPHGRIKGLKQPVAALVRLVHPIPFAAPDDQPVVLFIFLLVPENATQQHLEILSEIAQLLSDPLKRQQLTIESNPTTIHHLLTN